MWPMIIAAVSQATDPAKKLADDYCAYVTSQGGTTDYTTVYNIFKNEYLTDADKNLLTDWYDFRTGKLLYNVNEITSVWSLIYSYRKMQYVAARTIINNNEYASTDIVRTLYYNIGYFNTLGYSMRQVNKFRPKASISLYYNNLHYQLNGSGGCRATRFGTATDVAKVASIIWYSDGTSTTTSPANTYPLNETIIIDHRVNWGNRTNKLIVNGTQISSLNIDVGKEPIGF